MTDILFTMSTRGIRKKGLDIDMPVNYYPDNDDTQKKPLFTVAIARQYTLFQLA